ncbi:MAG TPA: SDR family NAD(P)-dependent oxidoreductase [Clostridiales bacterium]|nr:SDR family NAD(P)-dependent oxidoreductase [Clostridiales bacterium]
MINNKKIVLTGCNSGIGLEVLKILLKGENKILCVDKDIDVLKSLNSEKIIILQKDVSSKEAVDEVFEFAEENLGIIDIFFANAGYAYYEEIDYTDWDRVERIFKTNVFSPIYSYQKYIKHLGGRKGVFAVTISAIGTMAMPGFTLYSSTKFALHGFQQGTGSKSLKICSLPAFIPSPQTQTSLKPLTKWTLNGPSPYSSPMWWQERP